MLATVTDSVEKTAPVAIPAGWPANRKAKMMAPLPNSINGDLMKAMNNGQPQVVYGFSDISDLLVWIFFLTTFTFGRLTIDRPTNVLEGDLFSLSNEPANSVYMVSV
jgi:hypothetical protein